MKSVKQKLFVTCTCCGGTGKREFNGVFADTLELLKSMKEEISGAELARMDGCNNTAMCNRLVELEKHGCAVSRKYGKERLWKAK